MCLRNINRKQTYLALIVVNTVEQKKNSTGNQENINSSPVTKKLCDQEAALTLQGSQVSHG